MNPAYQKGLSALCQERLRIERFMERGELSRVTFYLQQDINTVNQRQIIFFSINSF